MPLCQQNTAAGKTAAVEAYVENKLSGKYPSVTVSVAQKSPAIYTVTLSAGEQHTSFDLKFTFTFSHSWSYTASGATITAECAHCHDKQAARLIVSDQKETGNAIEATVSYGTAWPGDALTVSYTKDSAPFDGMPKDAGSYTASMTISGATATVNFTISHALTHHEAVDATCTKDGNNEYYICNVCHKVFKDQAGTQETTVADEIVKAPGKHDWSNKDGVCKVCKTPCSEVHTAGTTCPVCGKYTPIPVVPAGEPAKNPFNPDAGKARFADVSGNAWYASAVNYVVDKGLMNGTGSNKFSPNADTTRGMIVTVLARLDGKNTAGTPWFAAGQRWAMEYEISDGTNMTGAITREQLVAMLFRYAVKNGLEAVTLSENLTQFTDASDISAWAVSAMQWAVGQGLIQGSNGQLRPQANASRAEVTTILMRFCELMKK